MFLTHVSEKKSLAATRGIKRSDARRERTKFADDNKVERPLKTLEIRTVPLNFQSDALSLSIALLRHSAIGWM